LPDIRAFGSWQHSTGVPFQPGNAELIGLRVEWKLWDWGVTHSADSEAEHTKARAQIGAEALVDQVKLALRKRWREARTAYDSLAAAGSQQQTAEEAYRLQQVRFE